mgnify:CR=1 FL=1
MLKVYNTLTRKKQEFVPQEPGKVGMYVCGVTPYNHPHIGNARPFVTWDVIKRYFRKKGFVPKDTADAKESIQYMDEVMKKIREINRRNRILKSKYKGDERFVRIHKRIEEQNEKREKPIISKQEYEIAENLANMKQDIDRMIFLDINKLDNVPAFQQDVLAIIGKELLKMHIRADIKDRKFINNLITTEYLQQRNYAY